MMFKWMVMTLLTWRRLLLFIMKMICASSGLTTWLQNRFVTCKCGRMQFMNGFKMLSWKCFTSWVGSTLLISLQRRCAMGLIFDAYKILACVLCLIFFSSLSWMFISCISTMGYCLYRSFLWLLLWQFLSPGFSISWLCCFLLPLSGNFDCHFSLIKCRLPYLLIITLGGPISLDMKLVDII